MLHIVYDSEGYTVSVQKEAQPGERAVIRGACGRIETRNDWETYADAERAAEDATAFMGELHIATETPGRWPRFDVIAAPKVGDLVSEAFNGDSTPVGTIARVSPTLATIWTEEGDKFTRRGNKRSGVWKRAGQDTYTMTKGHVHKRNPHI